MKSSEFINEAFGPTRSRVKSKEPKTYSKRIAMDLAREKCFGQQHGMYVGRLKDNPDEHVVIDGWSINQDRKHYYAKYDILGYFNYNGAWQKA